VDQNRTTKKARTSQAILEAAAAAVAEHGLQAASIDDIARRADVAVGSIYLHYGSKEGLFRAAIDGAVLTAETALLGAPRPGRTPLQRLAELGDAYVAFAMSEPTAFRLVALQLLDLRTGADRAQQAASIRGPVEKVLEHLTLEIRAAMAAGELPPMPARAAAMFMWGAWTGVLALTLGDSTLDTDVAQIRATMRGATALFAQGAVSADFSCADEAA
jgi:TetR/AcrR family transcriptional regulator